MEAQIYNKLGKAVGKFDLPEAIFGLGWNADMVHQVLTAMRSNERQGNAESKGRGEVRGGGKKPWQQKGTGRARHGSRRSPIWVGGGITHGPNNEKDYTRKINRVMKNKALFVLLAKKFKDGELLLVDSMATVAPKTKEVAGGLVSLSKIKGFEKLAYKSGNRALVLAPDYSAATLKSFRNLPQVVVMEAREVSPLDVASYKYILISQPEESLAVIAGRSRSTSRGQVK